VAHLADERNSEVELIEEGLQVYSQSVVSLVVLRSELSLPSIEFLLGSVVHLHLKHAKGIIEFVCGDDQGIAVMVCLCDAFKDLVQLPSNLTVASLVLANEPTYEWVLVFLMCQIRVSCTNRMLNLELLIAHLLHELFVIHIGCTTNHIVLSELINFLFSQMASHPPDFVSEAPLADLLASLN
jgi:hypothetical protein